MKETLDYSIKQLEKAFLKLKNGAVSAQDDLDKDGVIQRFEFTFELFWKTLKIFLAYKGIETRTPRDSLKEAFRINLIEDEKLFLNMLEDRNKTSHIYDESTADDIFIRIKNEYVQLIEKTIQKTKTKY